MKKVKFQINDENVVGHLFQPEQVIKKTPALVLTGPYTGVKEQVTGVYAQRLAQAGFVTLAFDHRNFGESDGTHRQHEEPYKKIDDLSAATAFLATQESVDAERIGAVGICLGGSYALRFAGFDPRIKALATVAAAYVGFAPESAEEASGKTQWLETYANELNLLASGSPSYIPAVSQDPDVEAGMPGQEPYDYYGTQRSFSPHWKNQITRLSSYNLAGFDSISATQHLQNTPSMVVHGTTDAFCSVENAQRASDMMTGEKSVKWINTTNHIELYDSEEHVSTAVKHVADWMHRYLGS